MKLEVGMYCRYKNFQNKIKIAKIQGMQKADEGFIYDYMIFDNDDGELGTNIIKASFNIIDILECGDYVNGSEVYDFYRIYDKEKNEYKIKGVITENCYLELTDSWILEENIKSIVTHEQFENIKYEI